MDVLILLDKLDDLIYNSRPIPLTDQVRVERTEAFGLLDEIRAAMPEEIKQARSLVKEREQAQHAAPSRESPELRAIASSIEDLKRTQRQAPPPLTAAAAEKVRSIVQAAESSAEEVKAEARAEAEKITGDAERAASELRRRSADEAAERLKRAEEGTKTIMAETARASAELETLLERLRTPAAELTGALSQGATATRADFDRMRARIAELGEIGRVEPPSADDGSLAEGPAASRRRSVSQTTEEWDALADPANGQHSEIEAALPGPDSHVEAERLVRTPE